MSPYEIELWLPQMKCPSVVILDERLGPFNLGSSLLSRELGEVDAWFIAVSNSFTPGTRRNRSVRRTGYPTVEISKLEVDWAQQCASAIVQISSSTLARPDPCWDVPPLGELAVYDRIFAFAAPHARDKLSQLPRLIRPPEEWFEENIGDNKIPMIMFRGRWRMLHYTQSSASLMVAARWRKFRVLGYDTMTYDALDVPAPASCPAYMRSFLSSSELRKIMQLLRPGTLPEHMPVPGTDRKKPRPLPMWLGQPYDEMLDRMHFYFPLTGAHVDREILWQRYQEWLAINEA